MSANNSPNDHVEIEQPFLAHLVEMRDRLLRVVLVVLALFAVLVSFSDRLYTEIAKPLMAHLPAGASMIATDPAGTFFTPMKLALVLAIFLAIPFILYQAWAFVAPALYTHERKLVMPLMISSTVLFYAGMAFAYYVVFPLVFGFFIAVAPEGVSVMTDIGKYLDFILKLFFAFGIAFEVPVATIVLVWAGVTTPEALGRKRPYIIVGAFVIGMLLTPPDIISQTLLALPMWLLFELGVVLSRYFLRVKRDAQAENELQDEEAMEETLDRYEREEQELRGRDEPRD